MNDIEKDVAKAAGSYYALPVLLVIAAAAGIFLLGRCSVVSPTPFPPKVQAQVDRDRIARAVDTSEVNRLAREEVVAKEREHLAAVARRHLEDSAAFEHHRADSLADVARAVVSSADSSAWKWQAAYQARTAEVAILKQSLDSAKAETHHANAATEKADTTAAVDLRHAVRADSLVTTLIDVATHPGQCKIAWLLPCPTRKQAVVGGVLVGVAGTLVATGKIKIPIALRF